MKKNNITAFCCHNALFGALDPIAVGRLRVAGVRIVEVPCSGKIDAIYLLKAFEKGADAVVAIACEPRMCTTIEGSTRLGKRVKRTKELLAEAGLDPERLFLYYVQPPVVKNLKNIFGEVEKAVEKLENGKK